MDKRVKLNKFPFEILIISFFLIFFVFKSVNIMQNVPFYDFDEAHRAENAKRMKDHGSLLVPLSGSSFDRDERFKILYENNSNVYLYYHLERPGLIYLLMQGSASIFGSNEFAYRLPSFLLGVGTIFTFIFMVKKFYQKKDLRALSIGLLALIASWDLWLSSQYAQLDTGITFFLFLSLLFLIFAVEQDSRKLLAISGISFALAVLSKGPPAIIFALPLLTLFILKKISIKTIIFFVLCSLTILIPWIGLVSVDFGLKAPLETFVKFAFTSSAIAYTHIEAPVYWYLRWWFEALRPGWVIFLSFFALDFLSRNFGWKKLVLLSYILGGLIFFSLAKNKIWWYVLPLVPAMAYYIFISASDFLNKYPRRLLNLSLVVLLASLPVFLNTSNKISLLYGLFTTILSIVVLLLDLDKLLKLNTKIIYLIFLLSITFSLLSFNLSFPEIKPYAPGVKEAALEYQKIEGSKCLWVDHLPAEAALFYSNAGQVNVLNPESPNSILYKSCINNYMITPLESSDKDFDFIPQKELIYKKGNISLIKISQLNP